MKFILNDISQRICAHIRDLPSNFESFQTITNYLILNSYETLKTGLLFFVKLFTFYSKSFHFNKKILIKNFDLFSYLRWFITKKIFF